MALVPQPLLSFSFASPNLSILRLLRRPLKSSTTKCFLHPHRFPRRRNQPVARLPDDDVHDVEEDMRSSPASSSGAHLDDEEGGDGWCPPNGDGAEEGEQLSEYEAGEWDPPVSPFRPQAQEHNLQDGDEEEDDEDGGDCPWRHPSFFLPNQEEASTTTTAAVEEILAFARSPVAADGSGFAEFLAGYSRRALGEDECVEVMRRMGDEGLALGCLLHFFRWMTRMLEEQPMSSSPQAWLVALVLLGRARMADDVLEILANLPLERGFREVVLYNAAMSGVAYCGRYGDTWKIFELMEKNNVQPDHITSSIMLMVMKKRKASAKDAWEFFQRMDRKGVKWSLDASAYLIKIFCDEGLKNEALIFQLEMEKRGIPSNTSIYNVMMNAYCKCSQIEEAEGLFLEVKEKGLKPTTLTYNILMDAYSRRLQPEVVESLLLEMHNLGLVRNARSYNCLISAYGQQKKMSEKAEDAFLRMKADGIKPTSSSYTSLLRAYAVTGQDEKAHTTYTDMRREGLKPSLETYTALLDIFRRAGDTEKLMDTWKSMIDEKAGGTRVTYHMVLDGLAKHGLYVQARDVISEFGEIGLPPTTMTYNILMNAYAKGGQHYKLPQLLKEMSILELKPDSVTYSTMIYAYVRVRDFSRAFYYHKEMVRSGQVPDAKSYRKLLNTLDVKSARKSIKNKSTIVGIIKGKYSLKHRKEKKDEFWKNSKKRSMTQVNGYQRKRFL
ncbi:pentatricopeptide repeat-containing protein At5g50280, chloroplastic-like [Lolium rigidum]|uniref:pentatricopeptide repeat-containing protein At5g50280, chloroplastic-like n=1 Tax=Lolium rigidum TaxID=89674 RepID=UPI001F5DB067|nr:pentatricopeptide repeat-containing protein At5g50280, chloroplastic-like [Lolium rigidum]